MTQQEAEKLAEEVLPNVHQWLIEGGGGHEDGDAGLRAMTVSGVGLVEFLAAYREGLMSAIAAALLEAAQELSECHPAFCRDEMLWRKTIAEAERKAVEEYRRKGATGFDDTRRVYEEHEVIDRDRLGK